MMKHRKFLFITLALSCALTACDSPSNTYTDKGKETQIMPGITEQQPQQFTVPPEQLGEMGKPVGAADVQNGTMITDALFYTVNKVTMFENSQAAGLSADVMKPYSEEALLNDNGELSSGVKLVLMEVTVQNVRANPKRNITDLNLLCADTDSLSAGSTEASFFELFPSVPAYFSNPTGKRIGDDWKEYYAYSLPVGQSKNLTVGWYVDTEQYDPQNLYLTFGYDEYKKYIKLVF